jgi:PAS domain S-box-containing protein
MALTFINFAGGMQTGPSPDQYLQRVLNAFSVDGSFREALDVLPVPVYTTEVDGRVSYWNRACLDFAGREPELGRDRWCVTWRIYTTTGEPLPHEECPMAVALKQQRPIRNAVAIAERPDGSRVAFRPYPTPLFDENGALTGAVNMIIDVTDEQSHSLAEQAGRCRRLADAMYDRETSNTLAAMGDGLERTAQTLRTN